MRTLAQLVVPAALAIPMAAFFISTPAQAFTTNADNTGTCGSWTGSHRCSAGTYSTEYYENELSNEGLNNQIESLQLAADCRYRFYDGTSQTGAYYTYPYSSPNPSNVAIPASTGWRDKASSIGWL